LLARLAQAGTQIGDGVGGGEAATARGKRVQCRCAHDPVLGIARNLAVCSSELLAVPI